MPKHRVIGRSSNDQWNGIAVLVASENEDAEDIVLRITQKEGQGDQVEGFSASDDNILEGLKLSEQYYGPDDPRLPSDILEQPIGKREDC